ncbi:preprotein translocase subunit YajC [Jeotgalibaca sp. MA1X17-3]|uniref:preprotein translocase subunit YajC n=1 Tax=Jeotgalibaca sp. MA1X17-3 TaxID=2908211 RepID=UPI001F2F73F4|nr:preprotein translocase subunit YajC [Jeotgalibaca sp. MA1X17-3]UJF15342.1 preprotein translocase subunit YajC [Jeotgalibaca sp. MA1X17-3]
MWESILAASIVLLIFIILIVLVYYIVSSRGMKQRKKHFESLHQNLSKGQNVSFSNGIYGTIQAVHEDTVDIQVKSGAVMTVSRYAVSDIIKK